MARRILAVLVIVACGAGTSAAQEHEEAEDHEEALQRHRISLFTGYTWVPQGDPHEGDPQGTVIAPTIGVDYSFFISHKFAVGLYNDLELTSYLVKTDADTTIPREYAYVGAVVGIYEPFRGLELFGGPGMELEKNKNFFVVKLGLDYAFIITGPWATGFTLAYDFKEEYNSWSAGLVVARRF